HKGHATGTAFVAYRADASRHFVFNIRNSASGLIETDGEATKLLASADHVHVMGSSLFSDRAIEVALSAIETVKARGGTVSFDPNVRREIMQASGMRAALDHVLARADIFLPSGEELFLFSSAKDERGAVEELLARGLSCIVLKKGAAGAAYHDRHGVIASSGFAVDEVDPTGAGDCFGAAFVSFWLRGAAPAEALRIANACGALAVTRKGPMEGIFPLEAVEAFIATGNTQ
ncbi:MAG: sugar kinase, partial [Mesorhizobium sp.]